MASFFSKFFGGSKSEKDVKAILPTVKQINEFYEQYQSLSNDELRNKTEEFRARIKEHLIEIDDAIAQTNKKAEETNPATTSNTAEITQVVTMIFLEP